ncbi:MAG: hypothetical protein NTW83_06980, partial [Cyanobacteria bacterium]|nr:hypothetical protein [Cyanobacteriota bacterium]
SGPAAATSAVTSRLPSSLWLRDDGTPLGGWRWVVPASGGTPQLLFVLGAGLPGAERFAAARPPAGGGLNLRARPVALASLGLLPQDLPAVARRSSQLEILSAPVATPKPGVKPGGTSPAGDGGLSWLWGSLTLEAPQATPAAKAQPAKPPLAPTPAPTSAPAGR